MRATPGLRLLDRSMTENRYGEANRSTPCSSAGQLESFRKSRWSEVSEEALPHWGGSSRMWTGLLRVTRCAVWMRIRQTATPQAAAIACPVPLVPCDRELDTATQHGECASPDS